MISQLISRLMILIFGTLYPAYRSYKAVKTKDVREYVKWMMYWIVFAFFTALENAADILVSWLPLYYEIKIAFLIWLLSPATKGSSILYRKFVHPWLTRHEKDIDKYISSAKESGYTALLRVGRQGLNAATDTFLKTAVTGQHTLINTIRKYSSMQDLHRSENLDAADGPQMMRGSRNTWPGNEQENEADYNFDDDYRILERQYNHSDNDKASTGEGNIPRTSSFPNVIQEAQIESDIESAEELTQEEANAADQYEEAQGEHDENDTDYVPPQPTAPVKRRQKTAGNNVTDVRRKRRSAPMKAADDGVSQMRGYSTLPRSRASSKPTTTMSDDQNYGGTLPRASRRRRKVDPKSYEA